MTQLMPAIANAPHVNIMISTPAPGMDRGDRDKALARFRALPGGAEFAQAIREARKANGRCLRTDGGRTRSIAARSRSGLGGEDGLYDIEPPPDRKDVDFNLSTGVRAARPIHSMWLRLTVDAKLRRSSMPPPPPMRCPIPASARIAPDYRKLVGLAIRPGYNHRVKELLGGVQGCTHLTELAGTLATAAFQTLAGQVPQDPARKPFQLDKCHALATTSPSVARYYPQWYREPDHP